MAATLSVGGFVARKCECGDWFSATANSTHESCGRCRRRAQDRARQARRAAARALVCNSCGTELLRPAARCGFCMPGFDAYAALDAFNHERPGGAVTAARAVTHGRNP